MLFGAYRPAADRDVEQCTVMFCILKFLLFFHNELDDHSHQIVFIAQAD